MKYDYMVKERPNIYQPSRAGDRTEDASTDAAAAEVPIQPPTASEFVQNNHSNDADGYEVPHVNYINRVDGLVIDSLPNDNDDDIDDDDDNDRYPMDIERNDNDRKNRSRIDNDDVNDGSTDVIDDEEDDDDKQDATVPQKQLCAYNRRSTSALKQFSSINGLDSIMEIREKLPVDASETPKMSPQKLSPDGLKSDDRGGIYGANQRPFQQQPQSQDYSKKKPIAINQRTIIRPEENWRNRSNSNSLESNNAMRFKGYRNFANNMNYQNTSPPSSAVNGNSNNNNNNNNINTSNNNNNCRKNNNNFYYYGVQNRHHQQQYNNDYQNYAAHGKIVRAKHQASGAMAGGIDVNNWRNECIYNSTRNCGMSHNAGYTREHSAEMDEDMLSIGLSPPSESLLMQRRMQNRASDIAIRSPPPATASG